MKPHWFTRPLARLRVGRKLLLICLLDLSAVLYVGGILVHAKYQAIDLAEREIAGSAYVKPVRAVVVGLALAGAGEHSALARLGAANDQLAAADAAYAQRVPGSASSGMSSSALRAALTALAAAPQPDGRLLDRALDASRALITRIGNQSNLIVDPNLDSHYVMAVSELRYPTLLDVAIDIGVLLHRAQQDGPDDATRIRCLVLDGQLDEVLRNLRSDYAQAEAADGVAAASLDAALLRVLGAVAAYRSAANAALAAGAAPARVAAADAAQRALIATVRDAWDRADDDLDRLLRARVERLYSRMWLQIGGVLVILAGILCLVYIVARQITRPLRQLAYVMDRVRRTGDHAQRAKWDSHDEIGQLVRGFNGMLEQLDHERAAQQELAATARGFAAQHMLVEAMPVPMMVTAVPDHEVLHANQTALAWLAGCTVDPWARGLDSAVRARFFQLLADHEAVDEFEVQWLAGGEPRWATLSARRLPFQGCDAVLTTFTPIGRIKQMEQRLELWAKVFEASSESILILDRARGLVSANASFYRATGFAADDVLGVPPQFLGARPNGEPVIDALADSVERIGAWSGEVHVRRREGGEYPAWLMGSAVRDARADVTHYICTLIDITDRKRSEARIRFLAEHDVLTELPNRARFTKRLGSVLARARHTGARVALLFIDLDRFKDINDSLGHHVGDGLLRSIAQRLAQAVRSTDTVSRLGGDEFTIVLDGVSGRDEVERLIDERLIPLVRQPHDVDGATLQVACSIGVALYPDDGHDIEMLMQNADAAMYQAKASGRNLVKFFTPEMAERARQRMLLETGLRTALEREELRLVFQPCVDARTGDVVGAEGLLRWRHPQFGEIGPTQFIPIAEDTGLIVPIGAWVIDEACRQMAVWREDGLDGLRVSVNVSALQLCGAGLLEMLQGSLATHRIAADLLELEITETVLIDNSANYLDAIHAIRALGVRLSLDDFGTGYSSLSYLHRFPIDRLKIDRTFVRDMLHAPTDLAVVKAIVELGHELGMRVVAEGVENERAARTLTGIGCDELQGYLYAQPLPGEELPAWIAARRAAADIPA